MQTFVRVAAVILMCVALSACALPYYWQAVGGQIGLLRKRVPIDAVIADPQYDTTTRERLRTVAEIRRFAVEELALPDNDSYTSFVNMDRTYVVWNVIATEEFSIDPVRWCFPVAGCVAYRGYFDRDDALKFQRRLDARGLDTYSGGSGAYSTLGYFDDPVLNTMLVGDEYRVAGTLFHELAHQRLYFKDDSELSEGFATAVEEYGVELWLTRRADAEGLEAYEQQLQRRAALAELVATQRTRLETLYAGASSPEDLRESKAEAFDSIRTQYAALKQTWGGARDFDGWFDDSLNNATLVAISTYRRWVPGLRARLAQVGLSEFYSELETLADLSADERAQTLEAWNEAQR